MALNRYIESESFKMKHWTFGQPAGRDKWRANLSSQHRTGLYALRNESFQ
jgi:hypothetical protein